jgi:hypothetical protein
MVRIRYLISMGQHLAGEVEDVTDSYAAALIRHRRAELAPAEEGEAGESVGPIVESDPSHADAHEQSFETHTRRQPETTATRTRSPR